VSKPETKTVEPDGKVRFLGHPELGAQKASRIARRLRLGNRETAFVSTLVEEHLRPTQLGTPSALPSHRAIYRFFRDLGDAAPAGLLLTLADAAGAAGPGLRPERWRRHVAYMSYVLSEGVAQVEEAEKQPKLLGGRELMQALGLEPGPEVGRLLEAIEEARAAGDVSTREEAITLASRLRDAFVTARDLAPSPNPLPPEGEGSARPTDDEGDVGS
jgi:poly(A) polymerase